MHVLIADDNPAATRTLAILLEAWGYEPVVVHDGLAALALLRASGAPPLAVLDCNLPGMSGDALCSEIRKDTHRPYTYIVLVTGRTGKEKLPDELEDGADAYLAKPVAPSELQARLSAGKRILALQEKLLATQRLLQQQASRDALTGLWNRRSILEILDRELARSQRDGQPVAAIMADLDYFKGVNDGHGHLTGDQVLRQAAQRLLGELRPYDTVGRYGGDEFLIVLPACGPDSAVHLAERLRNCLEAEPVQDNGKTIRVTLSLGVGVWDGKMESDELLRCADDALYRAKNAGRNRAMLAPIMA
jgi:two-component system cell cycle response regulator